jgi:hypothetical protein
MVRQIQTSTTAQEGAELGNVNVAPATVTPAAPLTGDDQRDALAGALPAWDLVPATPFIRRVK